MPPCTWPWSRSGWRPRRPTSGPRRPGTSAALEAQSADACSSCHPCTPHRRDELLTVVRRDPRPVQRIEVVARSVRVPMRRLARQPANDLARLLLRGAAHHADHRVRHVERLARDLELMALGHRQLALLARTTVAPPKRMGVTMPSHQIRLPVTIPNTPFATQRAPKTARAAGTMGMPAATPISTAPTVASPKPPMRPDRVLAVVVTVSEAIWITPFQSQPRRSP
jgi:hypothetical protein